MSRLVQLKPMVVTLLACALWSVVGCKKEEAPVQQQNEPEQKPAASTPPPATPAPLLDLAPDEPKTPLGRAPTPEDLEEEAAQTIEVDNLEAELDRLEAEIVGGS